MIVGEGDRRRPKRALHRIIRLVPTHSRRPPAPPDAARAQVSREPQGPTATIGSLVSFSSSTSNTAKPESLD